jgi:cell wall-associated NlpC family hydrolase
MQSLKKYWWNNYFDVPFASKGRTRAGCDCYGLVRLVYKEQLSKDLPELLDYLSANDGESISRLVEEEKRSLEGLVEVTEIQDFDLVVILDSANQPTHVGIVCDGGRRFLHTMDGFVGALAERLDSVRWQRRIESFWRFESCQ